MGIPSEVPPAIKTEARLLAYLKDVPEEDFHSFEDLLARAVQQTADTTAEAAKKSVRKGSWLRMVLLVIASVLGSGTGFATGYAWIAAKFDVATKSDEKALRAEIKTANDERDKREEKQNARIQELEIRDAVREKLDAKMSELVTSHTVGPKKK